MFWNAINTAIALLSLFIAAALWYRTLVAEHPIVDLVPRAAGSDSKLLEIDLQVRNLGERALILHDLIFSSPPRSDISVTVINDESLQQVITRSMIEQRRSDDVAELGLVVQPHSISVIRITLPDLDRWLDFRIRWSKQTPVVFPWLPLRVKRTPVQLRQLADAADAAL